MSAGGFIFEKVDLAYDTATNGESVRSWGLAVHKARCEAFLKATDREQMLGGSGWDSVQTNLYNEFSEVIQSKTVYIQDVFPYPSVDTTGNVPAFITFFRQYSGASGGTGGSGGASGTGSAAEYCIITARTYHCNPNYTYDVSYGLYINFANMPTSSPSFGESMAHAFALNGFGSYDIASSSFLTTDSTFIMASYYANTWSNVNSSGQYSNNSLLYRRYTSQTDSRLLNKTFQFGYAVKGTKIITLYRQREFTSWYWSLIGDIFGTLINNNDTHKVGAILHNYQNGSESTVMTTESSQDDFSEKISFTNINGTPYKQVSYIHKNYSHNVYSSVCQRTNQNAPTDIRYNSVFVYAYVYGSSTPSDGSGVDGEGNGVKGFLDTDLIRVISPTICRTCGATLQNENFVVMRNYSSYSGSCGFILGWDSSNESIM